MHTLNAEQIRSFIAHIRSLAEYMLKDLKSENIALQRDACVALIEIEEHRRGLSVGA